MRDVESAQVVTFGDLLRRHRLATGMTQEALAEQWGPRGARGHGTRERIGACIILPVGPVPFRPGNSLREHRSGIAYDGDNAG
jgi:hypothetical protein